MVSRWYLMVAVEVAIEVVVKELSYMPHVRTYPVFPVKC